MANLSKLYELLTFKYVSEIAIAHVSNRRGHEMRNRPTGLMSLNHGFSAARLLVFWFVYKTAFSNVIHGCYTCGIINTNPYVIQLLVWLKVWEFFWKLYFAKKSPTYKLVCPSLSLPHLWLQGSLYRTLLKFISKMFGLPYKWLRKATLLFRWRRLGAPSVIKSNQNKDQL